MIFKYQWQFVMSLPVWFLFSGNVFAHDPVFSPGPHVLFKDGYEIHVESFRSKQGNKTEDDQAIALKYGLSGDWVIGFELPYQQQKNNSGTNRGIGDTSLSTKYRFWRDDSLGVQASAAIIAKLKLNSGNKKVGSGTTDALLGFAYGYESLKWYRWASVRYRFNQSRAEQNSGIFQRGDRWMVDLAGGYRPKVNGYRDADTVLLLELNGEYGVASALNGNNIMDSGGNEWFVSPGIMWTLRNFAIKSGVQIPLLSSLNGGQSGSDYRVRFELEWHL